MAEYDTFVGKITNLPEKEEIKLFVRDCERFRSRAVKAVLSSGEKEGMDTLWIRDPLGQLLNEESPWYIEIIEELDTDQLGGKEFHQCE